MKKLNPLAIIALCVVAIAILAFTINDQLGKGKKVSGITLASKNANIFAPTIAYNPPHGEPGHNHDLPDGAPLTNNSTDVPLNTPPAQQPSIEPAGTRVLNPPHGEEGHKCGIAVGAPLTSTPGDSITPSTSKTAATTPGKNPAHGQPGHRCDIAVGGPLNSAAAPPTITNTTTTNTTTTPANTNKAVPATGLNPAHGESGHRCDIAVGAPLNSSVKSTATTTTATTPSTNKNSLNPAIFPNYNFPKTDSKSSAAPQFQYDSTGAALNPAHGQPGHDCSIEVGKPLKK